MLVKPRPGIKIRHPVTMELHEEDGPAFEIDPLDFFWAKLLEHRDVVKADDDAPADA